MGVKEKKKASNPVWYLVGATVLFLLLLSVKREMQAAETPFGEMVRQNIAGEFTDSIMREFVPIVFLSQSDASYGKQILQQTIEDVMPIYGYSREQQVRDSFTENKPEEYLTLEEVTLMKPEVVEVAEPQVQENLEFMQELIAAENEALLNGEEFVPHTVQETVDMHLLSNYETLVDLFYTIDANTMAGSDQLNAENLLSRNLTISKEGEGPQILIYHTHSQEGFADSVPGDTATTIVGVGERLTELLQNKYGYRVLHHTGQYDVETRDDAYANSLPAIEQLLAENPSVQVVIDLHRDSMPEGTKLVMDLDGRPTARFMFFNGLSRTKNTGDIAYLYNENLEDNLAFSFQMQLKAMEYYPGLTRKIYLKGYRYNMHLRPRTTLIELGAQNNTVEEAMNACDPLAHIIDMVLSGAT